VSSELAQAVAQDTLSGRLAGADPQASAGADLRGGGQTAQRLAKLIRRGEQQRLEGVDRGGTGGGGMATGDQQDAQGLAVPVGARLGMGLGSKDLPGGPAGVDRIRLAARPSAGPLGSACLHHQLPGLLQRPEQPGPVGAAAFHRPDQPWTRATLQRPGQQGL